MVIGKKILAACVCIAVSVKLMTENNSVTQNPQTTGFEERKFFELVRWMKSYT
jgi:hypothetical protein